MRTIEDYQSKNRFHWPSFLQLSASLIATGIIWLIAAGLAFIGFLQVFEPQPLWEDITSNFLMVGILLMVGALLLPSAWYALARLLGISISFPPWLRRLWNPSLLMLLMPVALVIGYFISLRPEIAWFALPPVHIVVIGIPVLWLTYLGLRGLPTGSPQRKWGIFGTGLVLGPAIILVLELLALLFFGAILIGIIYLFQPALFQELQTLVEVFPRYADRPDEALGLIQPYLFEPIILFGIFAFVAGIVPVIEELFKPIGVWLFSRYIFTPAEGFVAGLLSGAGFALFENLTLATIGDQWAAAVLVRVSTGLLHIITTGLMGLALVLAWRHGRYKRLFLTYLLVVFIHGLWNALALISAGGGFDLAGMEWVMQLSVAAIVILIAIVVIMFFVMLSVNRSLRASEGTRDPWTNPA
jgi:hypothetical protein